MIVITQKSDCCGCWACAQCCPKQCISMDEDSEGFLYPKVDASLCIDCKLCEKVCPVINQNETRKPIAVYAAKNPNEEIRMKSSSGGIFSMLAESTINQGGVVFGARFNEKWEVVHDYTETIEGIIPFRGSKYVQSQIGDRYIKAQDFLKEGREVLFSGTPCQIAGLNKFLSKEYDNLLTVDVVCHGVPSPLVWRDYLDHLYKSGGITGESQKGMRHIGSISFRDKGSGWKNYSFVIKDLYGKVAVNELANKNIFIQGFLRDLYLRPSCYACPSKAGKSQSDITIADFWGIQNYYPEFDDDKGTGLILINTQKASQTLSDLSIESIKTSYNQAFASNPSIEHSVIRPKLRAEYWELYTQYQSNAITKLYELYKPTKFRIVGSTIKRFLIKLIHNK